jgi:two-component system sensor histidine kinase BarA
MKRRWTRLRGLRNRVLLVALLPALTALTLGALVTLGRVQDMRAALGMQAAALAQQLAANAEFALFADDQMQLRALVAASQTTPRSVRVAALYDNRRQLVAYSGASDALDRQLPAATPATGDVALRHIVTVRGKPLLDPPDNNQHAADDSNLLGWALVEIDPTQEQQARQRILLQGLLITVITLAIGALLSWRLLRGIMQPLQDIMATVHLLQEGNLDARADESPPQELGALAHGINVMASAMEQNQRNLRARVTSATAHLNRAIIELEDKNRTLDEARAAALSAGEAKTEFLARMSHEIRTPVNALLGYARLLDDAHGKAPAQDPERRRAARQQADYTRIIQHTAGQLLTIIDDILLHAKLASGALTLDRLTFRLRDCVEDVNEMLAPAAHRKGLYLVLHIHDMVPDMIEGDPPRLRQILMNLLSNAIKFTHSGGVLVEISAGPPDSGQCRVRFRVTDSGPGIPAEEQPTLFDAFSQVRSAAALRGAGTGLGLSIARQLVEAMGGTLGVDSAPGQGACFHFEIPCAIAVERAAPDATLNGHTVYLCEAEPHTRRALRALLSRFGLRVYATARHEELIHWLDERAGIAGTTRPTPDALVLGLSQQDATSPKGHACRAALRARAHIPTLALIESEAWPEGEASGRDARLHWLTKPARAAHLHASLCELLGCAVPGAGQARAETASAPRHDGHIALIAEDNGFNRALLAHLLESRGLRVLAAADGAEALRLAAGNPFDLAFLDLYMPGLDGAQVVTALRAHGAVAPVFALTADVFARERYGDAPFNDWLYKPVTPERLDVLLGQWLDHEAHGDASQTPPAPRTSGTHGTPVLPDKLSAEFHTEATRLWDGIRERIAAGDHEGALQHAHQLHGVAGITGIATLTQSARDLETLLRAGASHDLDSTLHRLAQALTEMRPAGHFG